MTKMKMYLLGMLISVVLILISITLLGNTTVIAPVIIVLSAYLFLGCLIKLCKMNDRLKNTVLCVIDLLFWLP